MIQSNTVQTTPEILGLIAGIEEFKGAWRALGTLAPDRLLALRRVATIESIGSSTRIEGSKLSNREVDRLVGFLPVVSVLLMMVSFRLVAAPDARPVRLKGTDRIAQRS